MNKKILVVDGQHLNLSRCGGAGRYGRQLYQRLSHQSQSGCLDNFDIYLPNFQDVEASDLPHLPLASSGPFGAFKHVVSRTCPPLLFDRIQKLYNIGQEPASPPIVQTASWSEVAIPTLLHEVTNYLMLDEIGRMSLSPHLKLAVTFLDIQDYYYPEYFNDDALRSRRLAYSFYKDRADAFFAISEFTKQTMVERIGIPQEKIIVTHLAADDLMILHPSKDILSWAKSFGKFLIYPAKAWKHKNHAFLLKTLGRRSGELKRAGVKLLLTGGLSSQELSDLRRLITDNKLNDVVGILGFVSDEQLQALLQVAEFLIFPSLFEGFGMPVLEAMTLGCPVLSSNAGSLPEICGDAALLFDPACEDELLSLIDSILMGNELNRQKLIELGYQNCKRFSWNQTYEETVKVYKELMA